MLFCLWSISKSSNIQMDASSPIGALLLFSTTDFTYYNNMNEIIHFRQQHSIQNIIQLFCRYALYLHDNNIMCKIFIFCGNNFFHIIIMIIV